MCTSVIFLDDFYVYTTGLVFSIKRNRFLSQKKHNGKGYKIISVKRKNYYIHRLVAECFIPNPTNYKEVNHIDGNKANNHVSNLEWCTRGMNTRHAYKLGLRKVNMTEAIKASKISNSIKIIDKSTGIIYDSMTIAANSIGMKICTLQAMLKNRNPNKTSLVYLRDAMAVDVETLQKII